MSTQANVTAPGLSAVVVKPRLKRAPTLYAIIFFKLIKGVLFCAFGIAMYFQASHDLPAEWDDLLNQPFVEHVFERLYIHPENKFFHHIAEQIANVTETQVRLWAEGIMLFSLFPLVEGIGMLYRAGWAGWLTIGESAFFVPIEIYELAKQYSHSMLVVMIINVFIVWYLFANRQTLFRHHQPRH
jgi:uncharacterized membrane protein (DUF2068 family)